MARKKALVGNAGDEAQVRKAVESETHRRERQADELRVTLSTMEGRSNRWDLIGRCGVFESGISADPLTISGLAYRRELGLALIAEIMDLSPHLYLLMQREAIARDSLEPDTPLPESGE